MNPSPATDWLRGFFVACCLPDSDDLRYIFSCLNAMLLGLWLALNFPKLATHFFFLLKSIAYGLAAALVWLLFFQQDGQLNLRDLFRTQDNMPAAISYAKAVRAAAPAVVNVYTVTTQQDPRSYQRRIIRNESLGSGRDHAGRRLHSDQLPCRQWCRSNCSGTTGWPSVGSHADSDKTA